MLDTFFFRSGFMLVQVLLLEIGIPLILSTHVPKTLKGKSNLHFDLIWEENLNYCYYCSYLAHSIFYYVKGVLDYWDDRVQKKFPNNRNPNNCGTAILKKNQGITTIDGIFYWSQYCKITVVEFPIIEDPLYYFWKWQQCKISSSQPWPCCHQ